MITVRSYSDTSPVWAGRVLLELRIDPYLVINICDRCYHFRCRNSREFRRDPNPKVDVRLLLCRLTIVYSEKEIALVNMSVGRGQDCTEGRIRSSFKLKPRGTRHHPCWIAWPRRLIPRSIWAIHCSLPYKPTTRPNISKWATYMRVIVVDHKRIAWFTVAYCKMRGSGGQR